MVSMRDAPLCNTSELREVADDFLVRFDVVVEDYLFVLVDHGNSRHVPITVSDSGKALVPIVQGGQVLRIAVTYLVPVPVATHSTSIAKNCGRRNNSEVSTFAPTA